MSYWLRAYGVDRLVVDGNNGFIVAVCGYLVLTVRFLIPIKERTPADLRLYADRNTYEITPDLPDLYAITLGSQPTCTRM